MLQHPLKARITIKIAGMSNRQKMKSNSQIHFKVVESYVASGVTLYNIPEFYQAKPSKRTFRQRI